MLVGRFDFRDFVNVFEADGAHEVMAGAAGTLVYTRSFLEEVGGGRSFCDEGESAVRLDGNQGGYGNTGLYVRSASIEFFAEVHGLHATRTKSRTDRGRGSSLASRDEETLWKTHADKERNQQKVSGTHNYLSFSVESGL